MRNLSMVRGKLLPISLLIAAAGIAGCKDDDPDPDPVDMGSPDNNVTPVDMGRVDQGPIPNDPVVRIIHAIPDINNGSGIPVNGVRLCVDPPALPIYAPVPNDDANSVAEGQDGWDRRLDFRNGIPFRAVSTYLPPPPFAGTVRVYDEAVVDDDLTDDGDGIGVNCPQNNGTDSTFDGDCTDDTVPCFFSFEYDPAGFENDKYYTLLLSGFVEDPPPNECPVIDSSAALCPGPTVEVIEDTDRAIVTGKAKVRVYHEIMNAGVVDLCYDPDGFHPIDGPMAAQLLQGNVSPSEEAAYVEVDPATAAAGMVFLAIKTAEPATQGTCGLSATPAASGLPSNVIPVFFGPDNAEAQDSTPALAADKLYTVVASGDAGEPAPTCGLPTTSDPSCQGEWMIYFARAPAPIAWIDVE